MPGVSDFLESFLILMVLYGIIDDAGNIREKMEFNESLTIAQYIKLCHECDVLYYTVLLKDTELQQKSPISTLPSSFAWKQNT